MRMTRTLTAAFAGAVLLLAPACNDEDGDGAGTDEELEDFGDGVTTIVGEIDEEIEGGSSTTAP